MKKIEGSIVSDGVGQQDEQFFFSYTEDEKQNNEVNASNANLIFSPKFIPVYPELLDMGLTVTDALIFGFIDFYKSTGSGRFYFTNEQLGQIVRCSPDTASRSISKLKKMGFIKASMKIKAGGGQLRFITDISYKSTSTNSTSPPRQKLQGNKNKINNNNTSNKLEVATCAKPHGNEEINKVLEAIKGKVGISDFADTQKWVRIYGRHCVTLLARIGAKEFSRRLDILMKDKYKHKRLNEIRYVYEQVKGFIEPKSSSITSFDL